MGFQGGKLHFYIINLCAIYVDISDSKFVYNIYIHLEYSDKINLREYSLKQSNRVDLTYFVS